MYYGLLFYELKAEKQKSKFMENTPKAIALGMRLKGCKNVLTLGVHADFSDYSDREAELILNAETIYYPSTLYAELFDTMGKNTFPGYNTYKYAQDKIKQTALFKLMNIPHPFTKIFYGKKQQATITDFFSYPFIGKIPRGSAMGKGVFLINNADELKEYINKSKIAYIQEYLKTDRDMRIVVIGNTIVHSYWRITGGDSFKTNIAAGGRVSLAPVPNEAKQLALKTAEVCKWDDVGIDIIENNGKYYVLEGNIKYGREGFKAAGIDYIKLMETLIENGDI